MVIESPSRTYDFESAPELAWRYYWLEKNAKLTSLIIELALRRIKKKKKKSGT